VKPGGSLRHGSAQVGFVPSILLFDPRISVQISAFACTFSLRKPDLQVRVDRKGMNPDLKVRLAKMTVGFVLQNSQCAGDISRQTRHCTEMLRAAGPSESSIANEHETPARKMRELPSKH
jgi:hypothetical protein